MSPLALIDVFSGLINFPHPPWLMFSYFAPEGPLVFFLAETNRTVGAGFTPALSAEKGRG